MLISIIIIFTCFLTATLSGVFGLGGGILLMGLLGAFFSIPVAMVLHGLIQAFSNGSRAFFLRSNIQWDLLPFYGLGVLTALLICSFFIWVPQKSIVFIVLGSFPFLYLLLRYFNFQLNLKRKDHAFFCGVLVMATQLIAGASGPILDLFYNGSDLNRKEIVATKAFSQAIGHLIKLGFYLHLFQWTQLERQMPMILIPWMILTTFIGSLFGKKILSHLSDEQFKGLGEKIILGIGVFFLCQGLIN